jgi:hypothetical protein
VRIGDDIGGWKVTQIEERQLVLSLDDRSATYTLFSGRTLVNPPRSSAS